MLDRDIRELLRRDYLTKYEGTDSRIMEEMGLSAHQARIDIGIINGELVGYEIKSDHDNLRRLPDQLRIYTQVFDKLTVICGPIHEKKLEVMLPSYCGLLVAEYQHGKPSLRTARIPRQSTDLDGFRLASLLWLSEAKALLNDHGIRGISKMRRHDLWRRIANEFTVEFISNHVRQIMKDRQNWREE